MKKRRTATNEEKWQLEWRQGLKTAEDLRNAGLISSEELEPYRRLVVKYPFYLSRYYAELIDRNDPKCPIRLQAVPLLEELSDEPGFSSDPLGDLGHQPVAGVTHRYQNRLLLHLTSNCSTYCRFCFRKSLLGEEREAFFKGHVKEAFDYVAQAKEVEEVIFSGGDPLMVKDEVLEEALVALSSLAHIKRLRFHTRVPVTFPVRVTQGLIQVLESSGVPVIIVTHFNHPKEITPESTKVCSQLRRAVSLLLNQSVLLRGVNDNVSTLAELSEGLFSLGIVPYYLHQLDRAAGTHHFEVPVEQGRELLDQLKKRLPGYLVPQYVIDKGDADYKRCL